MSKTLHHIPEGHEAVYAAAPELFAALKVCRNRIIALTSNIESCDMHPDDEEAVRLADEVIAYATSQPGGQSA